MTSFVEPETQMDRGWRPHKAKLHGGVAPWSESPELGKRDGSGLHVTAYLAFCRSVIGKSEPDCRIQIV